MLARTRLRRFAIAAIEDQSLPWGPTCDCVGPISLDCDGKPIEVMDSPAGFIIDQLTDEGEASIGLPAIAIYADEPSATIERNDPCLTSILTLTVEIYASGDEDWAAEDAVDNLQERVLYRLFSQDLPDFNGSPQENIWNYSPSSMRSRTERQKDGRRVWMRQIEITLQGCDKFTAPDCDPCPPLCVDVQTPADCC